MMYEDSVYLNSLITEYKTQDNRCTAYPLYVTVQEQVSIGVMADGYTVNCPFGDGVTKIEYKHEGFDETYEDKNDLIKEIKEYYPQESKKIIDQIEEINIGYIWTPVEFFLTIKGAEKYMKANAHNHGKLRTYVHYFERRNFEMRKLLKIFGFKTGGDIKKCTECKKVLNEGDIPREEGYCNGCYKTLWAEEFNSRNDVR